MHEAVRSVIDPVNARPWNKLTRLVASLGPLIQKNYSPWTRSAARRALLNILHGTRLPLRSPFPLITKNELLMAGLRCNSVQQRCIRLNATSSLP